MIVSRRWATGDVVVLREVWRGRVWTGRPAIVVADAHDLRVFFVPIGVRWCAPVRPDGRWLHVPTEPWTLRVRTWERSHVLSLAEPGRPHAALAFWDLDWRFEGWYVNVQTPLDPTRLGFDYLDQELDVLIEPDLSAWRWKDEDELKVAIGLGMWTPADARRFRAEAMDWTDRIIRGGPPFDRDWRSWRPDPSWTAPELPPGWDGLET